MPVDEPYGAERPIADALDGGVGSFGSWKTKTKKRERGGWRLVGPFG